MIALVVAGGASAFGDVRGGPEPAPAALPSAVYQFDGTSDREYLGAVVARVGDVDGDGWDDLGAGSQMADPGGRRDAGSVFVYSGRTGAQLYRFDGDLVGDRFGVWVDGAGDVDADGRADVVVGAQRRSAGGAGGAYLYSGRTGARLHQWLGTYPGAVLGDSVAGAGDVNGDGHDDVVLGAPFDEPNGLFHAGAVYVYSGADGALLHRFDGAALGDEIGWSVDGVGDVDLDGRADILVGAPHTDPGGRTNAGTMTIYSGRTGAVLVESAGPVALDYYGLIVAGVGDVNGDGRPDVMVGAPTSDPNGIEIGGAAYLVSGADGSTLRTFLGTVPYDYLGRGVGGAGDVNGDGRGDVFVGIPHADPGGVSQAGTLLLYSGRSGRLLRRLDGVQLGGLLGWSSTSAGDVNADGLGDLFVAVPNQHTQNGERWRAGRAAVFLSTCRDADDDGYGAAGSSGCPELPVDCDDTRASVNPGAVEVPGNSRDDDCDPTTPVDACAAVARGPAERPAHAAQDGFGVLLGLAATRALRRRAARPARP